MSTQSSFFDDDEAESNLIAEGEYSVKLTNATLDETKSTRYSLEFTFANKRKVWQNLYLKNDKEKDKFIKWQLRELGVYDRAKEIHLTGKPLSHAILDALAEIMNSVCEIELTHNEWNGKTRHNVRILSCGVQTELSATPKKSASQTSAPPAMDMGEKLPF